MQNSYKSKLFSILGDSVSTLEGYTEPYGAEFYDTPNKLKSNIYIPRDTWWGQVISYLGGELLVNNSFSGSVVCKHPKCTIPSYGCSDERTSGLSKNGVSPDVIMVYMGTNDWGRGIRPTPRNKSEVNDLTIFSVAYEKMLENLKRNYPDAEIWCITLCVSDYENRKQMEFPYSIGGYHMERYCQAICQGAKKYNCRVFDIYKDNLQYESIDDFHPSKKGMEAISNAIIKQI